MRLYIWFLFLVPTMLAAETKISAFLPKGSIFTVSNTFDRFDKNIFPQSSYRVDTIATSHFNLLKSDDKSLDMRDYNLLFLKGTLSLISYNPNTEYYQFKFTFLPRAILFYFTDRISDIKGKEIKGNVLFDANDKSEIILEGQMNHDCTEDKAIVSKDVPFLFVNKSEIPNNPYLMFLCNNRKSLKEIIITTSYDISITIRSSS